MMDKKTVQWDNLLCQPGIQTEFSQNDIYRAACIGAVTLLFESGDCEALLHCVRHASAPESRARSLLALENLTKVSEPIRDRAVHALYELAVSDKNPEAAGFLQKNELKDPDPGWNSAGLLLLQKKHQLLKEDPGPVHLSELFLKEGKQLRYCLLEMGGKVLPNWTVLMRFLDDPSPENHEQLMKKFSCFSPDERKLLKFSIGANEALSSAAADLLLRYEDEELQRLCVEHHLRPSDRSQEALFYFLSGQWERYYASDSDYRRIRIAYEGKDPELQRRLIIISRDSGNSSWLRETGSGSVNVSHSGKLSDQHLLAASLIEQQQWVKLWNMLPGFPLLCMPAVCEALQQAGFSPDLPEEKAFYRDLNEKIRACKEFPPIPIRGRYGEGMGTAVGICGGGSYVAVLFTDRRILVWNTRDSFSAPIRISSSYLSFRKAVISHDGKYLCADCGKDGITVFSLPAGQSVKTIAIGSDPITGLFLQKDDRRLIVLFQNGRGIVYSFPGGTELFHFDIGLKDCRVASYSESENRLSGLTSSGECIVYDLIDRKPLNGLRLSGDIAAASEEYSRSRWHFVEKEDVLTQVNLLSAKTVYRENLHNTEKVRRIIPLFEGELIALGCLDGRIRIFDPTAKNIPAVLSLGTKSSVTGIWYDKNSDVLYGCNSAGSVRSWDFGLFRDMIRILPLLDLPGLNHIDEFVKKYPEPGVRAAAEWLKLIIAWRRRFDIEIEF